MSNKSLPISGDMAYELFMSNDPFPLHTFMDKFRDSEMSSGYALAVIAAYNRMVECCKDGRYKKVRNARILAENQGVV